MAFLKTALYLGVCLSAWMITTAVEDLVPRAENIHWVSFNFKTILTWSPEPNNFTYTVLFSELDDDWKDTADCTRMSESECDLTNFLFPLDKTYSADIQSEPATGMNYDLEDFPHTFSPNFNPYRESQINAVSFLVGTVEDHSVTLHISDPLTAIYRHGKLLTIRDVLQKDLKYKISYHKAGSTGKKEHISDSSTAEVSNLEAGQSYCFMVAAFIPSRPKPAQLGAWSNQQCTPGDRSLLQELSAGALVAVVFILLIVILIIVTVTVFCCKHCQQPRNKRPQSSATA